MGSSPQKSSGVHWCRRRVRFNEAPKFPEKVWEASGAEPGQVQGSGESSQRRFRRRSGRLPGQVQQGSVEGSGKLGAEPGQVQQGSLRRSQRRSGRLWCRAGESLGGFGPKPGREGSGEGVAGFSAEPGQAQPGEGSREGSIGAEPGQVQPGFGESSEKVPRKSGKLQCRARFGSTGFRRRFRRSSGRLWCKAR